MNALLRLLAAILGRHVRHDLEQRAALAMQEMARGMADAAEVDPDVRASREALWQQLAHIGRDRAQRHRDQPGRHVEASVTINQRAHMLARREQLMTQHPEITLAADLAPLMGDLEQEYWSWCLERFLSTETEGTA